MKASMKYRDRHSIVLVACLLAAAANEWCRDFAESWRSGASGSGRAVARETPAPQNSTPPSSGTAAADVAPLIKVILNVGPEGKGHREASAASRELAAADAAALPAVLTALDEANPLAANWLRGAVETIADRQFDRRNEWPTAELEEFVLDVRHQPRARRLAFEMLTTADATARDRLIPGMLDDPGSEFRRDAVQRLVDEAVRLKTRQALAEAVQVYRRALSGARDQDQCDLISQALDSLGQPVNLSDHFGFLNNWKLIGPFDNTAGKGFEISYPSEMKIDLDATQAGKTAEVAWAPHVTNDKYGVVDLCKVLGPGTGSVAYAVADFALDKQQAVEIRLTTSNAWKLWVNRQLISECDEYHRFMEPDRDAFKTFLKPQFDKYRVKAVLKSGSNTILIKICQNERVEDWAQRWQFQLRVCDDVGTAILSKTRPAAVPAQDVGH
jgi:hypothetical protein